MHDPLARPARVTNMAYRDERMHRRFQSVVRAVIRGSRVLDVACGSGTLMEAVKAKGCDVRGIDINPAAIALAKTKGLAVTLGDVNSFDSDPTVHDLMFADFDVMIFSKCLGQLRRKNELFRLLHTPRILVVQANPLQWKRRFNHWRAGYPAAKNPYVTADGATVDARTMDGMRRWAQSYGYRLSVLHGGLFRSRDAVFELMRL
jgi:SAM-dependent methyltransferase